MPLEIGDRSIFLATPLAVREGDFYSYYTKKANTGVVGVFYCEGVADSMYYHYAGVPPDSYNWNAFASPLPYATISHFYMQAPLIVAIGDSITQGATLNYSMIWPGDTGAFDFNVSWEGKLYNLDNKCIYQNMGHGGDTTTQISARFDSDVIALKPRIVTIEGGVNDIDGGVITKATYLANITSMLNKCVTANIVPIVFEIMPWTNGTTVQMQKRDDWNTSLRTLVASYPTAKIINWDTLLGKFRAGGDAGNLWDIQTAYDLGGVHYNEAGNAVIAAEIYKVLTHYKYSALTAPVVPALPTGLTLSLISGGVKVDFTDNSGGTAQTEIWYKNNSGSYVFCHLISAGTVTYNDMCSPVDLRYYKIRTLLNGVYSAFTSEQSIVMLGSEMMPSVATWSAVDLAWWNNTKTGFTGDASKLTGIGTGDVFRTTPFWTIGKTYRTIHAITRTSGNLYSAHDGTHTNTILNSVGTFTSYYIPTGTGIMLYSDSFIGTITAISIKEVLMP